MEGRKGNWAALLIGGLLRIGSSIAFVVCAESLGAQAPWIGWAYALCVLGCAWGVGEIAAWIALMRGDRD